MGAPRIEFPPQQSEGRDEEIRASIRDNEVRSRGVAGRRLGSEDGDAAVGGESSGEDADHQSAGWRASARVCGIHRRPNANGVARRLAHVWKRRTAPPRTATRWHNSAQGRAAHPGSGRNSRIERRRRSTNRDAMPTNACRRGTHAGCHHSRAFFRPSSTRRPTRRPPQPSGLHGRRGAYRWQERVNLVRLGV